MGGRRKIGYGEDELDPREAQRRGAQAKREKKQRIAAILEAFDAQPITADEALMMDRVLITMTEKELREFSKDEAKPYEMRRRALMILGDDADAAVALGEKARDRAFGKPMQKNDLNLKTERPINVIDFSKPLPDE